MLEKEKEILRLESEYLDFGTTLKSVANFEKRPVDRAFLKAIAKLNGRNYNLNYFFYYVRLLSLSFSQDISYKNDWVKSQCSLKTPNMYVYPQKLCNAFGIKKFQSALDILKELEWTGVLKFQIGRGFAYNRSARVFIQLNDFTEYLPSAEEFYKKYACNEEAFKKFKYNVVNDRGFFYAPLQKIANEFFSFQKYPHGAKDVALLLYANASYGDDLEPNETIKNSHIVTFGGRSVTKDGVSSIIMHRAVKLGEFAKFLNISYPALREMIHRFERKGLVATKFVHNKGTVIVMRCLDNTWGAEEAPPAPPLKEVFKEVIKVIKSYKEKRKGYRFALRDFLNYKLKGELLGLAVEYGYARWLYDGPLKTHLLPEDAFRPSEDLEFNADCLWSEEKQMWVYEFESGYKALKDERDKELLSFARTANAAA